MFEVMIVEVPIDPPMFEVRVLPDEERLLVVVSVVMVAEAAVSSDVEAVTAERLEIVVVASDAVPVAVNDPVVNDENDEEEARERTLPDQRRLEPAVIRVDGVV